MKEQLPEREFYKNKESHFVIKRGPCENAISVIFKPDISEEISEYFTDELIEKISEINSPLLIISECAEREIKEYISWGTRTSNNVYEQGGILIGKPFLIDEKVISVAEHAIQADLSRSNESYLKMGTESWKKMLDVYDEEYRAKGLYVVGWFHTHPNNLPVFMSNTDLKTQQAFFNQNWHFSMVLNPHKCLIACFNSGNADKCSYYLNDLVIL